MKCPLENEAKTNPNLRSSDTKRSNRIYGGRSGSHDGKGVRLGMKSGIGKCDGGTLAVLVCVGGLIVAGSWGLGGCGLIFGGSFAPGVYSGEIPCTLSIVGPSGEGEQEYTTPITLTIDGEGNFSVNGVELVVGAEVLRSIPTADLAFEVTSITIEGSILTVEYTPRPTLPGITVEGDLVETYRWNVGSIQAAGESDLLITDVDGTTALAASCEGMLTAE